MSTIAIGDTGATPLGKLWVALSTHGLLAVHFAPDQHALVAYLQKRFNQPVEYVPQHVKEATWQLQEYLAGKRREFTLPVDWTSLREFQRLVLQATCTIPYGQTSTYGQLAAQIERPRAARAVGRAEATNPMPLVLPCHRVIGADGKLHGYGVGEGLKTKEWLLRMEGAILT